jgi:hypothetical protein
VTRHSPQQPVTEAVTDPGERSPAKHRPHAVDDPHTLTDRPAPPQHEKDGDHDNGIRTTIDPESWDYWQRAVSALPPMTDEEIAAVAVILRRIDARHPHPPPP